MPTPTQPNVAGGGIYVNWTIPQEVSSRSDVDVVRIHRSSSENDGYAPINDVSVPVGKALPTSWFDASGTRSYWYLVTFVSSASQWESSYHITFFRPLPREARMIEQVKRSVPAILQASLTDEDYLNGLRIACQMFNTYPPETYYSLQTIPHKYEYFIIALAQMTALASRYLTLSIRDFRYSEPGGVVMDQDRGSRIVEALNILTKTYTQLLPLIKLDESADLPQGLGSVPLPISMGGMISSGILNILDIFTAGGR